MGRKKKVIEIKAEPEIYPKPKYLRGVCSVCPEFSYCEKRRLYKGNAKALDNACDRFRVLGGRVFDHMLNQTGPVPEKMMQEITDKWFHNNNLETMVNRN